MPSDPWPDEPDEFDPEARWGDPEQDPEARWGDPEAELVEKVTISEPSEPDLSGVDSAVSKPFWASVILVNLAVFALSLGPMLIYFRGEWLVGLGLVGGGTLALGRTYHLYRQFERASTDSQQDDGDDATADVDGENENGDDSDDGDDNDDAGVDGDEFTERNP